MNARGIHKDHLKSIPVIDSEYAVSSRLGPWRGNGDLCPQQSVQKGRFPHIGRANDGYETGQVPSIKGVFMG